MRLNLPYLTILRSIAVCGLFFAFAVSASGQTAQPALPTSSPIPEGPFEQMEAEMRSKRMISYAQKEHKENINRAQTLSRLGAEIVSSFKQKNHLDRDDFKKLDKLEKLTKSIRSASGGSDDETDLQKIPPDLPAVISKVGESADALKEEVEKTPRHVISTTVIDQANVLLELIRRVRGLSAGT